ncbi:hypothetical protein O1611_g4211 [Lasiodiplodia mahajangana]|uniref:Uncharacterized protein n=1 Tax=Lasiodiplodia mahajangana TaxID=1108764 RepID=A0ACC2JPK1_9PEZI|nr:hypothetical protein O1611_g4211 [Lasiodiplodia mahajangana]
MAGANANSIDSIDRAAADHAAVIARCFDDTSVWEYEKMLGNGSNGVVLLLRDRGQALPLGKKRAVLKVPIGGNDGRGEIDLLIEIDALQRIRGCAHIIEMIAYCEDIGYANQPRLSPADTVFDALRKSRIDGPGILLDYLENGSLLDLACIGLAYPPEIPDDGKRPELELETIREGVEASLLRHSDIALRNIMIGDRDPTGPLERKHLFLRCVSLYNATTADSHDRKDRLVEKLLLIDFGQLQEAVEPSRAAAYNINQASDAMTSVINASGRADSRRIPILHKGNYTDAYAILPQRGVNHYLYLDTKLRDLIALGMASDIQKVPPLEDMLKAVEEGMAKPASAYIGRESEESDDAVRRVMQTLVFDA